MARKTVNYLNNRDMLAEIHKSKTSFCEFAIQEDSQFDIVVPDINDIDNDVVLQAQVNRAKRIADRGHRAALALWQKDPDAKPSHKPKLSKYKFEPTTVPHEDLVFRVLTYEHVPEDLTRKKTHRTVADRYVKMNYIPFKHYKFTDNDSHELIKTADYTFREVGRSHCKNGEFSLTHGAMTDKLAKMFVMLVNKYGQRSNWRGYTYLDEMKGHALLQLSQMGLQFNEMKSDNPFSYYTASVSNSFTRVLNIEKQNQNLRDDLLVEAGQNPSFTRQLAVEQEIRRLWDLSSNDTSS